MTEAGFLIDGKQYPVPAIPDMDMDELQIIYDACGITLQGWANRESENQAERREWEQGVANPKWMTTLLHIAYQRGNPDLPEDEVRKIVRKVKWLEATLPMVAEAEKQEPELADPNAVGATSAPERSSSTEPHSKPNSNEDSGSTSLTGSPKSSDEPEDDPATTGTTESDGPSTSVPLRQVV